jgi:type IV secretion system protein VirB9
MPPPEVVPKPPAKGGRVAANRRPAHPQTVIDQANTDARVAPSTSGYGYGSSTSQRYPWWPGRLFEVYTAPSHPTTLRLPPGEMLAKGFGTTSGGGISWLSGTGGGTAGAGIGGSGTS